MSKAAFSNPKKKSSDKKNIITFKIRIDLVVILLTIIFGLMTLITAITGSKSMGYITIPIFIFWFVFFIYAFVLRERKPIEKRLNDIENLDKVGLEKAREKYLKRVTEDPENVDVLKKLANIYEKLGEKGKANELYDQLEKLSGEKEFEFNLTKEITLHQLEIRDLYFFDHFQWEFQPQINVLLGRNGFGKSYLLRFLAVLLQKNDEIAADFFEYSKNNPFAKLTVERDGESNTILRNKILFEKSIGKVPLLAIPDTRFLNKSNNSISVSDDEKADLKHHGAYHFLYQKPSEGLIQNFLYQLCITYLDKGKRLNLPIFELLHKVIGELSDDEFVFHRIKPIGRARFQIEVLNEGNEKPLPIQQASQGTLSLLAIFGLIYEYLKSVFPDAPEKELFNQSAIVFIDELDAHLHPAWQQKIIRLLRENFPNVQFFVTAHSPLVVAGCKEGEVAVLRKQENGFGVQLLEQDFIGYEAKELYEKVFEIEEKDESYLHYLALTPFQEEIEKKIKDLGKKRKKKPLSEKEEKELDRLYDDIYYMEKANDKYQQRREYSKLLIENRKLKNKIRKLEDRVENHDSHE